MTENKGPWYLLTGLIIGLVVGIIYSQVINPISFSSTYPAMLNQADMDHYRDLIAMSWKANPDAARALARLSLLNDDPEGSLINGIQARSVSDSEKSKPETTALVEMATAIRKTPNNLDPGMPTLPSLINSPTASETIATPDIQETATPTPISTSTDENAADTNSSPGSPTIETTRTFTPAPIPPLILKEKNPVCEQGRKPMMIFQVEDRSGLPIPGVQITIAWKDGQDSAYTGLYPETNKGYADFEMAPSTNYTVRAGEGGETVSSIVAPDCKDNAGKSYPGGWRFVFTHPR